MAEQHVLLAIKDGIATITLNRPEVRNAITNAMIIQITQWLNELRDRDDVRVVILRGAGDKAFCAGHDLKETAAVSRAGTHASEPQVSVDLGSTLLTYPKPTIAAVRGYVRQAGMWLSSSCDLLVAAEDATFALTGMAFGGFGTPPIVAPLRRVGRSKLFDLVFSADVIDAMEAKAIGLADRVVPVERFEEEITALATKLASRDPQAVRAGKEALALLVDMDTVKTLKIALLHVVTTQFFRDTERTAQRAEAHLASVRGTGATRRSY